MLTLAYEFVNATEPLFGLVQLRLRFRGEIQESGHVEICASGYQPYVKQFAPVKEEFSFWVAIHTHLLKDGANDIVVRVLAGKECVYSSVILMITRNDSALAHRVRDSLLRTSTPLFVDQFCCSSSLYDYQDDSLKPWFDRADALALIDAWVAQNKLSQIQATKLRQFVNDGYMILEDLIPKELVNRINAEIDVAVKNEFGGYKYGSSARIEQLHREHPAIRELWLSNTYLNWLELVFRANPLPCQTLTYVFGSQQDAHQDTIHLTPYPAGYMCGVWFALEDVKPESGELLVYPGSHRLPRIYMKDANCPTVKDGDWKQFGQTVVSRWRQIIDEANIQPIPYFAKAGTALVWHENLMHAGSSRRNMSISRRSIVVHCFAEGAISYYDSLGMPGHMNRA